MGDACRVSGASQQECSQQQEHSSWESSLSAPVSPQPSAAGLMGGAVQGSVGVSRKSQLRKARLRVGEVVYVVW